MHRTYDTLLISLPEFGLCAFSIFYATELHSNKSSLPTTTPLGVRTLMTRTMPAIPFAFMFHRDLYALEHRHRCMHRAVSLQLGWPQLGCSTLRISSGEISKKEFYRQSSLIKAATSTARRVHCCDCPPMPVQNRQLLASYVCPCMWKKATVVGHRSRH